MGLEIHLSKIDRPHRGSAAMVCGPLLGVAGAGAACSAPAVHDDLNRRADTVDDHDQSTTKPQPHDDHDDVSCHDHDGGTGDDHDDCASPAPGRFDHHLDDSTATRREPAQH